MNTVNIARITATLTAIILAFVLGLMASEQYRIKILPWAEMAFALFFFITFITILLWVLQGIAARDGAVTASE